MLVLQSLVISISQVNGLNFFDAEVEGLIQYTDGSAYNIITMNAVSKAEAEVADGETFNAETIAQHVAYNWSQKIILRRCGALKVLSQE